LVATEYERQKELKMPFFEYILLAVLGSSAAGAPDNTTLTADALIQPNGGTMILTSQEPPKKEGIRRQTYRARRHKHRRHPIRQYSKDKKGLKV
jgi:hypothetical protein